MPENVFQNPEFWKANIQVGDWIKVRQGDIAKYTEVFEVARIDNFTDSYFYFYDSAGWRRGLSYSEWSLMEIRRRGSIVNMVETVLPAKTKHEEWSVCTPDVHCESCGIDFDSKISGTECPNCHSNAITQYRRVKL